MADLLSFLDGGQELTLGLAVAVASAAWAALLFQPATASLNERSTQARVATAAVGFAMAIWAAYAAGVTDRLISIPVAHDPIMSAVALVVALVIGGAIMVYAAPLIQAADTTSAAGAGAALGAAGPVVYYIAVAALRLQGRVSVDPLTLALTGAPLVIGWAAAFGLAAHGRSTAHRLVSVGLVAAGAVAFGLAAPRALNVTLNPRVVVPDTAISGVSLQFWLLGLTGLVGLAAALASLSFRSASHRQHARESAFADLTREGIIICDGLRILDVNAAAARLIGLDPAVLRGRAFRDFLDAPDAERLLSASLAKPQEVGLKSNGGEAAWVEMTSRDLTVEGRARRVFTLRDLSDQRRKEHQIRHLAYHDPLTGLANRAAFNEAFGAALKRGGEVALFCIDLDKFKEVNDVFGHAAGDEMLKIAARRITEAAPDAMVFRLGGDEFVAIGTGPDAGDADKLAARVTARLNTEVVIGGRGMRSAASVGFAVFPHHGATADTLFANADAALYRAKADGRGLSRGFEPEMDLALREKRALQQDLATAISRNEMFLHWMPQADTITGEINGFEALIRWKHPTRGVVPPVVFIPVAEETAAIVQIGEWVLRTACREGMKWPKPGKVAVNLSPIQFQHGDIVELVHSILLDTGLPASRLELEITEGVLLDNLTGALQTLRRLKALGVQIAMDDFGTGYSSLSYLQAFPFDRIKIDASFIRTLSTSPQAKAIVRSVVALGASLDMPITAEGVETPEQRAFLAELHCEEIQGYLVGRPSPVVSFESPFARPRYLNAG